MSTQTKTAIRKAFLDLLNQQPLGKITVRDITDACGINRNSFYYHYTDIPTLLQEIVTDDSKAIIAAHPTIDSLEECLSSAVTFAKNNKRAVLHIFNSTNRDILEQYLLQTSNSVVTIYINTAFSDEPLPDGDKAVLIRFFKCVLFGFIIDWISDGMSDTVYQQFLRLIELKRGSAMELIQKMKESD